MKKRETSVWVRLLTLLLAVFLIFSDTSMSVMASGISQTRENSLEAPGLENKEAGKAAALDVGKEPTSEAGKESASEVGNEPTSAPGDDPTSDVTDEGNIPTSDEVQETASSDAGEEPTSETEETTTEEETVEDTDILPLISSVAYDVSGTGTTALYIGETTVDTTADTTGTGWSWEATTGILTLNGYNGRGITATGGLTIKLDGSNTITVDTANACGIKVENGELTIDKTNSDTDDSLTIQTSGNRVQIDKLIEAYTTVNGGTLSLNLKDTDSCSEYLVRNKLTMNNASILNSEATSTTGYVVPVASSLYLKGSGTTNVKASGYTDNLISAVSTLYVEGSGEITISAVNTKSKNSVNISTIAAHIIKYTGTSTLHATGMITTTDLALGGPQWKSQVTLKDAPTDGYLWYDTRPSDHASAKKTYLCDTNGLPLKSSTFEWKDNPTLSFTDSSVWDIPVLTVGNEYRGAYLAGGLHGTSMEAKEFTFALKEESSLPAGLALDNVNLCSARIIGTPTAECPGGTATIVVTKKDSTESVEFTIQYGAITEKDTYITINGTKFDRKSNNSGTNWSYTAADHVLTLDGYSGGPILSEGDLTIKLKGSNTITLDTANACGIKVENGELTIDKTNSDTDDSLTIQTSGNRVQIDKLIEAYTTVNGGTLSLNLKDTDSCSEYLVRNKLTMNNASILNSEATSTTGYVVPVASSLYLKGSGTTNVKASGYTDNLISAVSTLYVEGSGEITISAVNTKSKNSVNISTIAAHIIKYTGTSTLHATGMITTTDLALGGPQWKSQVTLKDAPTDGYLWYDTRPSDHASAKKTYLCDTNGLPLKSSTFEWKDNPTLSFTDSSVWDIPVLTVGNEYRGAYLAGGLHGTSMEAKEFTFALKEESSLPAGLALENANGRSARIIGTPTAVCPGGTATIVVTKKNSTESVEFTIQYAGVTVAKPVTGVTLSKTTLTLPENGSDTLTATVTPDDASVSTVTFTSSNINVAKVTQEKDSNTATITAVGPGTTTITTTTTQGNRTATCQVTVKPDTPSITFDVGRNVLRGFVIRRGYTIKDKSTGNILKTISSDSLATTLDVENDWFGKTLVIVQNSGDASSDPCEVTVAHIYGTTYGYDATKHWTTCTCGAKLEEEHTFEWVINFPATETNSGQKYKKCICSYIDPTSQNTVIPAGELAGITLKGITAPAVGATPDVTVESADMTRYTIGDITWIEGDTSLSEGATFAENKNYTLAVKIHLQETYTFPTDLSEVVIGLEGMDSTVISNKSIVLNDAGTKTYTVSIAFTTLKQKVALTNTNTSVTGINESYEYTGSDLVPIPNVKVTVDGEANSLSLNTDYTVAYTDNKEPGSATIIITGMGQYTGTLTKSFTIYRPISKLTLEAKDYEYTGSAIDPTADLVLKDRDQTLSQTTDYVVEKVENNMNPGYMKITIKGGSNGFYTGTYAFENKIRILPPMYDITVTNGKAYDTDGNEITKAAENTKVIIKADTPALGKTFHEWQLTAGSVTISNSNSAETFFMMPSTAVSVEANYKQIETLYASPIEDQLYTGSAIKVLPLVYDGGNEGALLTNKKDYTLSYKNNTNAGEASVIITGKGNYKDKQTITFNIIPHDISTTGNTIYVDLTNNKIKKVTPVVKTVINGKTKTLTQNRDYTLTYNYEPGGYYDSSKEYKVTVTGKGNYTGSIAYKVVFIPRNAPKISKAKVTLQYTRTEYDGTEKKPSVKVVLDRTEIDPSHYTVTYADNQEVGKATVTITGDDVNLYGTRTLTFNITGKVLSQMAQISDLAKSVEYTGSGVEPSFKVVLKKAVGDKAKGTELVNGTDYEVVAYKNNTKPGTATVTVKGKGLFTGNLSKTFKISTVNLTADNTTITCDPTATFSKTGAIPANIEVKYKGSILDPKTDYSISYRNHKKVGTATLTVTGKGAYRKSVYTTYEVIKASFAGGTITVTAPDVKAGTKYKALRVTVADGKTRLSTREYTVSYSVDGIPVADLNKQTVSGKDVMVTVTPKSGSNYESDTIATTTLHVGSINIASVIVRVPSKTYTGKPIEPKPSSIKLKNKYLTEGTDYEIVGYTNNVSQGSGATMTIKGKGEYYGTKTVRFTISRRTVK